VKHTVCSAFWKHINVRSDNNVYACCRYKTPVAPFDGDLEKVLSLPVWEKLRQDSMAGVPNPNCQKCYDAVDPAMSLQHTFNQDYSTDSVALEFLEIGLDNICNLTCVSCSPDFSSAWGDQESPGTRRINIKSTTEIAAVPASVVRLLFLGGEPLMTNRHRKFLERVPDPGSVEVTYNTNGTFLLDCETSEVLSKFKKATFIVSIDGYGELNDQVRPGSQWAQILKFIQQVQDLGHGLEINTVIHAKNFFGMIELGEFVAVNHIPQKVNVLTYPSHLDIRYLDNQSRHQFVQQLLHCDFAWAPAVIKYINTFAPVVELADTLR
jgi:sulfatase maturation enzyme AslB (radical SAM superfamily)